MTDPKFRRLRVLHLVSADGNSAPNPLLVPLLTRGNRERVESQVLTCNVGDARFAVVRQSGLPVHELALSRQRFSPGAFTEAQKLVSQFKPDVLHAWGSTAQLLAAWFAGGKSALPVVWSVSRTVPLDKDAAWLDRLKFGRNLKYASRCQRIVFPSAVAAANHRRAGLPESADTVIGPGVDAERFKPDDAARQRVRQQLELPKDAILVGMYAPFSPAFDHNTFLKAIGELMRTNSNLYCVLAGRGTIKGNAALSTMLGGATLGTRTRVVGEWTDLSSLFNACDVVCSSATTDATRLTLAISMLCGVLCVATGVGAQGEVLGSYGVSVEPGSPDAMARGIRRILEMPGDRRAFMAQAARKHVLQNFNVTRAIEKYHELYAELITGEAPVPATNVEVSEKETAQSLAAAEIITNRAAAAMSLGQKPAAQTASEQNATVEPATGFGAVQASAAFVKPKPTETDAAQENASENTSENTAGASTKSDIKKDDSINFDALATSRIKVTPIATAAIAEEPSNDSLPWSDDDAHLLDGILVAADPVAAKANADKAAGAAKSAAAKAATNAAFAAALAANPDSAKGMDPKVLAALSMGGFGNSGSATSPRAVAGKAPPAPTAVPKAAPLASTPVLTVVRTGTSTAK